MRAMSMMAMLVPALIVAVPAAAQVTSPGPAWGGSHGAPGASRVWQGGRWVSMPRHNGPVTGPRGGHRWGGMVDGRWHAGSRAPGGWRAYHRPSRGRSLPRWWMQSDFRIPDFMHFGLSAPPYGYHWTRYYDDAVLIDDGGRVWDSVSGLAWADADADVGYGSASAAAAASASASVGAGYDRPPIAPVDPDTYYDDPMPYPQGGYAPPAVVAPPAVQHSGCPHVCPGQGGGYHQGGNGYYQGGNGYHQGGTSYQGGSGYYSSGYASGGYYYPAPTVTTIVIQSAPVVTTTVTEEIIEEVATSYVAPRRVVRKYRPRTKLRPRCGC